MLRPTCSCCKFKIYLIQDTFVFFTSSEFLRTREVGLDYCAYYYNKLTRFSAHIGELGYFSKIGILLGLRQYSLLSLSTILFKKSSTLNKLLKCIFRKR